MSSPHFPILRALSLALIATSAGTTPAAQTARAELGLVFACSYCDVSTSGGRRVMQFSSSPVILSVVEDGPAALAGLQPGDTLTHVNGLPLASREGGETLADLRAGVTLTLSAQRAGRTLRFTVTPATASAVDPSGFQALARALGRLDEALSATDTTQTLFSGTLAGVDVRVSGRDRVTVTVADGDCFLNIVAGRTRITLRGPSDCRKQK